MSQPPVAVPVEPPQVLAAECRSGWLLDPDVLFLNHGCFGARRGEVVAAQQSWRDAFERRPVEFLDRKRDELLERTKGAVGAFLGMDPAGFGFVTNATDGVNAVLRSLELGPDDEIATTNHVYNAVRQTMRLLVRRTGAGIVEIDVPLPLAGPDDVASAIADGLTPRTRLLVIDHVTSPTAIRFPIERILAMCAERGIDVLVDGAHAPGMLDLDVDALDAAYYTGNLHKWVCAPPGTAFLHVRADRRDGIHPTVISHFLDEGLAAEFAWQGTRDVSGWLAAATAIETTEALGGWADVQTHNHRLATWAQGFLCRAWDVEANSPADGSMLGSMAAITLPEALRRGFDTPEAMQARLYDEHRIEVPVFEWADRWILRVSCQAYNGPGDYERLADAVASLRG
jgi:isopenicillin-N epimerase